MTNFESPSRNLPATLGTRTSLAALPNIQGAAASGPKSNPILRYFNAIRRLKWLVLLLAIVGFGGGYLMTRLRPQRFEVNGQIQIAPSEFPSFIGDQWTVFFKSYSIVTPVVISNRLYIKGPTRVGAPPLPLGPSGPNSVLFNGFSLTPKSIPGQYRLKIAGDGKTWLMTNVRNSDEEKGVVGDSVGREFGYAWLPQIERRWYGTTFNFEITTPREASDELIKDLEVKPLPARNPRFLYLTLQGQESAPTAAVLNDLMGGFVESANRSKKTDVTGAVRGLDSQLTIARAKMEADDKALQNFQIKTITAARDPSGFQVQPGLQSTTPSAYNTYVATRSATEALRRQRRDLQAALQKLKDGQPATDVYTANTAVSQSSPQLMAYVNELFQDEMNYNKLLIRYTDTTVTNGNGTTEGVNMPRLHQRINELRHQSIPQLTEVVLARLDAEIAENDSASATQSKELKDIPTRSIPEMELTRTKTIDEGTVADLTKKYYDATAREALAVPDVSISSPAIAPLNPGTDKASVFIAAGGLAGLALGIALALLLDATDKRVRYADQITGGLGLTILGVIPEIRRAKGEVPSADEAAQAIEAFRTVRLNLAHALGEGPVMLTISSPSPGDGKSLVSSNLALSFAEAGYRTVLIDGDSRRGELHRTFGAERRPGLLDFLAGELPMNELLRPTSHPQLKLISGGSRKRNAPELLGTSKMRDLLASMREQFDVVLVDTPPLGAGIDPFVLATITGNLMLVVRAGVTERDLAEAKLQVIDQLPIRMVGAVLNDVQSTMDEYKYYSYSYGYGATDEPVAALPTVKTKE